MIDCNKLSYTSFDMNKPVFFLDIDGVLKKSTTPLECGQKAIDFLNEKEIPYILLSNGTNDHEQLIKHLENILKRKVNGDMLVASTTPVYDKLKEIDPETPILALTAYRFGEPFFNNLGMKKVFYPIEIANDVPHIVPEIDFCQDKIPEIPDFRKNRPKYNGERIEYIILLADSTTWYIDMQIAVECLMNGGIFSKKYEGTDSFMPKVITSNPDVTYACVYPVPRLTMGAFSRSLETVYQYATGKKLDIQYLGKPYKPIFDRGLSRVPEQYQNCKKYMVGDSLSSDIRGGNLTGLTTVLVLSGKDQKQDTYNENEKPDMIFDDVYVAVTEIAKQHGIQ